jgi:hypothetical protein
MRIVLGWPSVYAGIVTLATGVSLYAGIGNGLIWAGICLIAAGVMQVLRS